MSEAVDIQIRRSTADADIRAAAQIMGTTDPWLTLARTPEMIYTNLSHPLHEIYVAVAGDEVIGAISIAMSVPVIKGYIGALAVAAGWRDRGIGSRLLKFAEKRILRESPNVFLCCTSFNTHAQRFYARHGYAVVGELTNYNIAGHGEILMRKTTGPWSTFKSTDAANEGRG